MLAQFLNINSLYFAKPINLLKFSKYYLQYYILSGFCGFHWIYQKGAQQNLISFHTQYQETPYIKTTNVNFFKNPMIANLYYWEQ